MGPFSIRQIDPSGGVVVSDNVDSDLSIYYEIYDSSGDVVYDADDNFICIDTAELPVGEYSIVYYAIDRSGNESANITRPLVVCARAVAPTKWSDIDYEVCVANPFDVEVCCVQEYDVQVEVINA